MNKGLKKYIEDFILPKYEKFDKGHNKEHVKTVIDESLVLSKDFNVNLDMVYTIAAYHDLGLCKDRKTHHLVSGEILFADKHLREWFTEEQILVMKEAVEDHRASAENAPRSIYGRIVAEADRDIIPIKIIKRTILYSMQHTPSEDKEVHYKHLKEHMKEKYAEGGYLKLWFKNSRNFINLQELRKIISDEKLLRYEFERCYMDIKK